MKTINYQDILPSFPSRFISSVSRGVAITGLIAGIMVCGAFLVHSVVSFLFTLTS